MDTETVSNIANILSCIFAFLALIGIGTTIWKINKITNKSIVNVFGSTVGEINISNQPLKNQEE
jgi:hypothetical protein